MPLSVEEVTSHNNFSSNNRIKRSLPVQDSDYTMEHIIQYFLNRGNVRLLPIIDTYFSNLYALIKHCRLYILF